MSIKKFILLLQSGYKHFKKNLEIIFIDEEGRRYKIKDVSLVTSFTRGKSKTEYVIEGKKYNK